MNSKGLAAECDRVLIEGMHPGLRTAIDESLAQGMLPSQILRIVLRNTGGRKTLTSLGVAAYLDSLAADDVVVLREPTDAELADAEARASCVAADGTL